MNARELVESLTADICRDFPELANGLFANQLAGDDPLWEWAVVAAEHVLRTTGGDDRRIAECAEAFVVTSLDFLRLQARFMKTGEYAHTTAAETSDLYADGDRMTEYLDGLALSYAMWPNRTRMLRFFANDFVSVVPPEVGCWRSGPGTVCSPPCSSPVRDDVHYVGVDISRRVSISYSAAAFVAAGVDAKRYELVIGDRPRPAHRPRPSARGGDLL